VNNIRQSCLFMMGDANLRPHDQIMRRQGPGNEVVARPALRHHTVEIVVQDSLLLRAVDPGFGRLLGLVASLDHNVIPGTPVAYGAVGLFAYKISDRLPDGRSLGSLLTTPVPQTVLDRVTSRLDPSGSELARIKQTISAYNSAHHLGALGGHPGIRPPIVLRGVIAIAAAVPAPERPSASSVSLAESRWLPTKTGPSQTFRQEFTLPSWSASSLVAVGRFEQSQWRSRHELFKSNINQPARVRANAMALGRKQAGWLFASPSYISDLPISAQGPALYRFCRADLFGRYGAPTDISVPVPKRPPPPPPAPQVQIIYSEPVDNSTAPASPGDIVITVPVPSIYDVEAGSLDITAVRLRLDSPVSSPNAFFSNTFTISPQLPQNTDPHQARPLPAVVTP